MKGISVFVYVILFTMLYLVESSAFLSIAGAVKGVPAQVWAITDRIHGDLVGSDTVSIPKGMETFIAGCSLPAYSGMEMEQIEKAIEACQHPQNSSVQYPGVLCVFYSYYGHGYNFCKPLRWTPDRTYLFDGETAPMLRVVRNLEDHVIALESS